MPLNTDQEPISNNSDNHDFNQTLFESVPVLPALADSLDFEHTSPAKLAFAQLAESTARKICGAYKGLVEFVRTNSEELEDYANKILLSKGYHSSTACKIVSIALKSTDDHYAKYMRDELGFNDAYLLVRKSRALAAQSASLASTPEHANARVVAEKVMRETASLNPNNPEDLKALRLLQEFIAKKIREIDKTPEVPRKYDDLEQAERKSVDQICGAFAVLETRCGNSPCQRMRHKVVDEVRQFAHHQGYRFHEAASVFHSEAAKLSREQAKLAGNGRLSQVKFLRRVQKRLTG